MNAGHSFGRVGLKTLGFYALTTSMAVVIGLLLVASLTPGLSHQDVPSALASATDLTKFQQQAGKDPWLLVEEVILKIVPSNIIATAAQGQMLGVILFSGVFGFFVAALDTSLSSILLGFFQGVFQVMLRITQLIMKALPFGVFCLVAKVVATTGFTSMLSLGYFFFTVLLGLLLFTLVALPLLLRLIGGIHPFHYLKAMGPALLTAFSTSSSAASLPAVIECVEKRAGISNRIASLVLPLGSSCNLSGSALYQVVSVIFIAQVYGYPVSMATYLLAGLMSLVTSMGMAGIPSASLMAIVMTLQTLGLPAEAIGMIIATDRILDMCRTTTNVFSNSCCAALVARSEGEELRPIAA